VTLGTRNRLSLGIVHRSIPCMCPVSGSEGEGENGVTAGSVARKLSAEVSSPGWASPSSFWRDKSVKRYGKNFLSEQRTAPIIVPVSNHNMADLPYMTYGFIGIGVMGWGMAKNLRAKIPESAQLVICELVETRRDSFIAETDGLIEAVHTPREVAEKAVSIQILFSERWLTFS
jgi:hypothetical protein